MNTTLTAFEIRILRECVATDGDKTPWGGAVGAALEVLRGSGYLNRSTGKPTATGLEFLNALCCGLLNEDRGTRYSCELEAKHDGAHREGLHTWPDGRAFVLCLVCKEPTTATALGLCQGCWEVDTRLPGFLLHEEGRRIVREALAESPTDGNPCQVCLERNLMTSPREVVAWFDATFGKPGSIGDDQVVVHTRADYERRQQQAGATTPPAWKGEPDDEPS
jgi:hypothetical protein